MECHGILESALKLHGTYKCVLDVIMMDNDSSSQNILQWDYDKAILHGMMTKYPQMESGQKK